jgi:hypothetical protein
MTKGKSILRLVMLALSMLAMGPRARGGDCASGIVQHPHGDPWGGAFQCSGTCSSGACDDAISNPAPGVYLVFCSCDGVQPQTCCHIVATVDTGAGTLTFTGQGTCGSGGCPEGSACAAQHWVVAGEYGFVDRYAPACGS